MTLKDVWQETEPGIGSAGAELVPADVHRAIEQLLYREVRLLDEGRFREWLDLFADDARYWIPVSTNRYAANQRSSMPVNAAAADRSDTADESEMAVLDDNKETLCDRVARLETGLAWAEDPRSRTCHIVTNVEVEPGDAEHEVRVYAKIVTYRARLQSEEDVFVGRREDVLRRIKGEWKISRRKIILLKNVVTARNMSHLF